MPNTTTPGNVVVFQNSYNVTTKVIMLFQDGLMLRTNPDVMSGLNINSNNNGQCIEYLNPGNVRTLPRLETISTDEWHQIYALM